MSDYGTNTRSIVMATALGAILTAAIILALVVVFRWYEDGRQTTLRINGRPDKLETLREGQSVWLNSYRMMDPEKQIVAIPINRAMGLVVAELSDQELSSSERVAVPEKAVPEGGSKEERDE
jgi:hypothetical protein